MNALIIEDEQLTARNLEDMLRELLPGIYISDTLQSVSESIEWFDNHTMPDVVFMDIHLADGSSFSIFDKVDITCPIIFTTAYDEYALRAFEVNSVDYLLKPVSRDSLIRALDKIKRFSASKGTEDNVELIRKVAAALVNKNYSYRSSFLIPVKDKFIPLSVKEIAYIYLEDRVSIAVRVDGTKNILQGSLDDIMQQLDPALFFRANRQFIVSRGAVQDISTWFGNRISVNLKVAVPERIIVSRTHAQEFKRWITE